MMVAKAKMMAWVVVLAVGAPLGVGGGCAVSVDELGGLIDPGEGAEGEEGEGEGEGEGEESADCQAAVDLCEQVTGTFCLRESGCGLDTLELCAARIATGFPCETARVVVGQAQACVEALQSASCEAIDENEVEACQKPMFTFGDVCE